MRPPPAAGFNDMVAGALWLAPQAQESAGGGAAVAPAKLGGVPMGAGEQRQGIEVGQRASLTRVISDDDIEAYARLTGDRNPLHLDEAFAIRSRFGRRVAHGLLSAGLISAVLGTRLPGPGAVYLQQTLRFVRPVYPGDTVTATVEVTAYREDRRVATLRTTCTDQGGATVLDGEAIVLLDPAEGL
ncbi:MAG TPA: MaoC family dehydratase [bacterium]|nr:MaoC family dehydratase [bacterium]